MKIFPMVKKAQEEEEEGLLGQAINETLGLDKVHSSDCIKAIMAQPQFSKTLPKDWKRRSKKRNPQGQWVRLFENKAAGAKAEVIEVSGGLGVNVIQAPVHGPVVTGAPPTGFNGILLIPPHTVEYQGARTGQAGSSSRGGTQGTRALWTRSTSPAAPRTTSTPLTTATTAAVMPN